MQASTDGADAMDAVADADAGTGRRGSDVSGARPLALARVAVVTAAPVPFVSGASRSYLYGVCTAYCGTFGVTSEQTGPTQPVVLARAGERALLSPALLEVAELAPGADLVARVDGPGRIVLESPDMMLTRLQEAARRGKAVRAARRAEQERNGEKAAQLSLADLCVLGHAWSTDRPVLTADRHWSTSAAHGLTVPVRDVRDPSTSL